MRRMPEGLPDQRPPAGAGRAGKGGTPVLVPQIGYCEYYCSLCTQVCPTGAIKELTVPEKPRSNRDGLDRQKPVHPLFSVHRLRGTLPGVAKGDQIRHGRTQAARKYHRSRKSADHRPEPLHRLRDLREQMPGGRPAIYVTSVGEQRSEENQLLLKRTNNRACPTGFDCFRRPTGG